MIIIFLPIYLSLQLIYLFVKTVIKLVLQQTAEWNFKINYFLIRYFIYVFNQGSKTIVTGDNKNIFSRPQIFFSIFPIKGNRPLNDICQTFASRRGYFITPAPKLNLLFAVFFHSFFFIQSLQFAVIS